MKLKPLTVLLAGSLTVITPLLQGCFPVAAAGVTAGALAIADRRTIATQTVDEEIEIKGEVRIRDQFGDKVHINVTSYNRKVLLTGEATSPTLKSEVVEVVRGLPNIDAIIDEIQLAATATLTGRSNDSYITTKVKARFVEASKFGANHVKVVTEAGSVYLLGLVTEQESRDAIEIARTTSGVRKVINLMEIIGADQARALDQPAAAPVETRPPAKP